MLSTTLAIIISAAALVAGVLFGWLLHKKGEERRAGPAEAQAKEMVEAARGEAERTKRNAELEAKELLFRAKSEAEKEAEGRLSKLKAEQSRLLDRQENLDKQALNLDAKEQELDKKDQDLQRREKAAETNARSSQEMLAKAKKRLEEVAKLTQEQAKEQLVSQIKVEAQEAAAAEVKQIEEQTEKVAKEKATNIIAGAVQRFASEYVSERTVSVVELPSDEMKGRIIGREGRNIRALEAATGVDLIVDDTPEAVILSCFNPVRREVARLALTRLIADGRIHPSRIEEVVQRAEAEVEKGFKASGEQAIFDLGLHRVHNELVILLGQLKFRSSYSQNLLQHSVEVGYIAGVMATELGVGVKQARRAGLLHDIGKAADHEIEGSHAAVGAQLAQKYGESPKVVHAIAAHHGEVPQDSLLACLVDSANVLSSQRPGARRQRLQSYIQRLNDLEKICGAHSGVSKVYAIQAGREVRVIVRPNEITDDMAVMMSKDLARQIEDELTYPAQIKVSVIRESRSGESAR